MTYFVDHSFQRPETGSKMTKRIHAAFDCIFFRQAGWSICHDSWITAVRRRYTPVLPKMLLISKLTRGLGKIMVRGSDAIYTPIPSPSQSHHHVETREEWMLVDSSRWLPSSSETFHRGVSQCTKSTRLGVGLQTVSITIHPKTAHKP